MPNAALGLFSSGRVECAAKPENSVLDFSLRNLLVARVLAERRACQPNWTRAKAFFGMPTGQRKSADKVLQLFSNGVNNSWYAFASLPSDFAVSSTDRSSSTAEPSSVGCATGDGE